MESIRVWRKYRQMTLSQVAEKTGLSISFLSDLERGRTDSSLSTLRKLALCFHTQVATLLEKPTGEEGTMLIVFKQHLSHEDKDDLGMKIEAVTKEVPQFYELSTASSMHIRARSQEALGVLLKASYSFECILDC